MELTAGLLIIAMIAFVIFAAFQKGSGNQQPQHEYVLKPKLLSIAERSFFGVLSQAVGKEGVVFAKIRVADVLQPRKGLDKSTRQKAFNRISAKHFDYVICNPGTLEAVLAIELDDKSHQSKTAAARDEVKNSASKSAGFPLIRIKAKRVYSLQEIRVSLSEYFPNLIEKGQEQEPQQPTEQNEAEAVPPSCPKCSSIMLLRESQKGKHAGKKFWGCSQFPACRGVQLAEPRKVSAIASEGS